MKKTSIFQKFFPAVVLLTSIGIISSCSKDDDTPPPPPPPSPKAKVLITHASPNAPAVDLLANGASVKTGVVFPQNTGYLEVNAGALNLKVNVSGTTTTAINADVTTEANKNYSVFAIDSVSKIKSALVVDDLTAPAAGKAHIRFFHFSANAPGVDVGVIGTGGAFTSIFSNRTFNDQGTTTSKQAFQPVDAGTINVAVRVTGTTTQVLGPIPVNLEAGKIYTVFAKGFVGGTGVQALGAEIIVNK